MEIADGPIGADGKPTSTKKIAITQEQAHAMWNAPAPKPGAKKTTFADPAVSIGTKKTAMTGDEVKKFLADEKDKHGVIGDGKCEELTPDQLRQKIWQEGVDAERERFYQEFKKMNDEQRLRANASTAWLGQFHDKLINKIGERMLLFASALENIEKSCQESDAVLQLIKKAMAEQTPQPAAAEAADSGMGAPAPSEVIVVPESE